MRAGDAQPLDVTLEITPKRMPDGSQSFPILYGPFTLQGIERTFALPVPALVKGSVSEGLALVSAQLTFVPTEAPASLAKPIQARSSLINLRNEYSVQLLAGTEYRVTVQPTEPDIPPYTTTFVAEQGAELNINYSELPRTTQSYWIKNLPSVPVGQSLTLKARAKDTNQIISSKEKLGEGRATLEFMSETLPPYKLEIAAESLTGSQIAAIGGGCENDSPLVPTFTIDDSSLKRETSTRAQGAYDLSVELPTLPKPVEYSGAITLCESSKGLENLVVSLRSNALAISNLPQGVTAAFSVSTTADRKSTKFCTRAMPGEYVVVVTPPANVKCEIFADKRQVQAERDPDTLELRVPTRLNGKILDNNMAPMANAKIDAVALGIDTTMMLAANDLTVPIYNRSRQTSTDSEGKFALFVDVGVYDLIVKPPMQSGFGWQIRPGLNVGSARREDFTTRVELTPPALVEGGLRYDDNKNQGSLAGAEVHAYTVEGEGTPNERTVEIGYTQADDNGNIMLLISPESQQPSW